MDLRSMDDILNPSTEENKEVGAVNESATGSGPDENDVAAENKKPATEESASAGTEKTEEAPSPSKVKDELTALARERERIRQKEALLDERLSQLPSTATDSANTQTDNETKDPRTELKELRKQYREALTNTLIDPDDEESVRLVDELEDRMEELRLSIANQSHQAMTAQERSTNDFKSVFTKVHEDFPFLAVDHPDVNAELNDDINTHYEGRIRKGDSPAVALRKAVDKFAPSYAKSLGKSTTDTSEIEKVNNDGANRLVREKLSKSGFSEVRSASRSQATKPFTGPTPLAIVLGKTT